MNSTKTALDLRAGIRANLEIIRGDLRVLRTDLACDWRYLRTDIAADRSNLLYQAHTNLDAWRDRRRQVPALTPFPALALSDGPSPAPCPDTQGQPPQAANGRHSTADEWFK